MSPRIAAIIAGICAETGVTPALVLGTGRQRRVVEARHRAMRAVKAATDLSLPQIGRLFGGRDHTTVLHALRKVDRPLAAMAMLPGPEPATAVMVIPRLADLPPIVATPRPVAHVERVNSHLLPLMARLRLSERRSVARILFICGPTHGPRPFSRFNVLEPPRHVRQDTSRGLSDRPKAHGGPPFVQSQQHEGFSRCEQSVPGGGQ